MVVVPLQEEFLRSFSTSLRSIRLSSTAKTWGTSADSMTQFEEEPAAIMRLVAKCWMILINKLRNKCYYCIYLPPRFPFSNVFLHHNNSESSMLHKVIKDAPKTLINDAAEKKRTKRKENGLGDKTCCININEERKKHSKLKEVTRVVWR